MTREETANLLAVVQTYDQRTIGQTDVLSWHGALGDLDFDDCRDAVVSYYSDSTDRVMPAHVRKRVSAVKHDRAMRAIPGDGDGRGPMPSWFRTMYEKSLAETRASGKYPKRGPLAAELDRYAGGTP